MSLKAAEAARSALENGLTTFRTTYPLGLQFPYRFKANEKPFFVAAIYTDGTFTYIKSDAQELPALYEVRDGTPNLVNFEYKNARLIRVCPACAHISDKAFDVAMEQAALAEPCPKCGYIFPVMAETANSTAVFKDLPSIPTAVAAE